MQMEDQLSAIVAYALERGKTLSTQAEFDLLKSQILGPNGSLTAISKSIASLAKEDRPKFGQVINKAKGEIEGILAVVRERVEEEELARNLGPAIDPTLPCEPPACGSIHPLTRVKRLMCAAFEKAGFVIQEGSEIDTEWYCFDALNTPDDHPARDEQDTLFFPSGVVFDNVSKRGVERYLLRTHTSTVQVRTMLESEPPLRIIAPGRCFRRDTVDATHSANFHQLEGLYIDKGVTVMDLKGLLEFFIKQLFGEGVETRLRPSFFPFTEPSFELDMRSGNVGKLSNQWIELFGCGMVDPAVLENVGLDAKEWSGYAFGMGVERIAMLLYGVDDIRHFYQNDLRFLKQFA